jgi:hypothetical protein
MILRLTRGSKERAATSWWIYWRLKRNKEMNMKRSMGIATIVMALGSLTPAAAQTQGYNDYVLADNTVQVSRLCNTTGGGTFGFTATGFMNSGGDPVTVSGSVKVRSETKRRGPSLASLNGSWVESDPVGDISGTFTARKGSAECYEFTGQETTPFCVNCQGWVVRLKNVPATFRVTTPEGTFRGTTNITLEACDYTSDDGSCQGSSVWSQTWSTEN